MHIPGKAGNIPYDIPWQDVHGKSLQGIVHHKLASRHEIKGRDDPLPELPPVRSILYEGSLLFYIAIFMDGAFRIPGGT
jgi:hypothetical protein